jgi:predicted nucleic acid-binding Zn ribbon protein
MQTDRSDCAICGKPLPVWRAATSVVCESPTCAFRFATIPPHEKCLICTRPVPPLLRAARHCGGARCRQVLLVDRPSAALREARATILATAPAYQEQAAAAHGLTAAEGRSYALSVIPHNPDRVARLPVRRRREFEAHLRKKLAGARQRLAQGAAPSPAEVAPPPEEPLTPRRRAELAVLGAGCGACRGNCCRGGGDHAYHGEDSMVRYLHRYPDRDDDAVIADYLGYVPSRTMSAGCIYQQAGGCALPRDMRADICNQFFCDGLNEIRFLYGDGRPVRAFFVHYDGTMLHGGQFVEIPDGAE